VGTPVFLIAFLMLLPIFGNIGTIDRVSLTIAIVVPIALSIISRLMARKAWKPVYYPLALLGLAVIGLAAFHAINPSLLQSMLSQFSIFGRVGAMLTVMEVSPLLFPNGQFSLAMAWSNFGASFFIAFVSMGMLIYVAIKDKGADKILFLIWSIIMLIAVLGQRRFAYYYTVNAALLTGYFSWKMLDLAGLRKLFAKSKEVVGAVKKFKKAKKRTREKAKPKTFMQPRGAWVRVIVVGIVIFFVAFFPNIPMAKALAGSPNYVMDEGWYTSLLWLKDNSPDPFGDLGDPDFYYRIYKTPFQYPESAYGVMSWWDYGYFIMQIAHRIPNANPGQIGAKEAGQFFTAQNESSANELADRLGTKYVMIDYMMATPSKFYAMAEWAGSNSSEFYEYYYVPPSSSGSSGQWIMLYYPAYYNSTVVRLYNFDGKNVTPTQPIVISYEETEYQGQKYKEATSGQYFPTYENAQAYVANQTSGNYRIVGDNPFNSIVPLEELSSYELVYQSNTTVTMYGQTVPSVKIFNYTVARVSPE
jgi:dolichyl-diphosphooligosaccharide--protein glycosyltransferase